MFYYRCTDLALAWSELRYPWQRAELLAYLEDAQKSDGYTDLDEMKALTNFIFDDHDFNPPTTLLGLTLLSEVEIASVATFVEALNLALGSRTKSIAQIHGERMGAGIHRSTASTRSASGPRRVLVCRLTPIAGIGDITP
jgi:hypothetical protein